jgi:hypothetical protein
MSLRALHVVATTSFVVTLMANTAALADDTVAQCIAANESSLSLRKKSQLLEALKCAASTCPGEISTVCAQRVTEIVAAIPSVVFQVKDAAGNDLTDVNLEIDGKPSSKLGVSALSLNPGSHTFRFTTNSKGGAEKTLVLRDAEKNRQERIVLTAASTVQTGGPSAPPVDSGATETGSALPSSEASIPRNGQRTAGIVIGVVGLGALVAGSVFGGLTFSKWASAKNDCATACGQGSQAQNEKDTASTFGIVSTIGFIAGGVAFAAGVILFVSAPKQQTAAVGWVGVSPSLGGLSVIGGF